LLDGFPRNEHQAEALDRLLKDNGVSLDAVLDLQVPQEEAVRRVAGRRLCRTDDSHVFHTTYNAPRTAGLCDLCGGELYQRQDDTEHTVRRRLDVHHRATAPLIAYYRARNLLVGISALGPVEEITQRSMDALHKHSAGERAVS
jgi:adenylate kinase